MIGSDEIRKANWPFISKNKKITKNNFQRLFRKTFLSK